MRVVLDSNVLLSAFASPGGVCDDLYETCLADHEIVLCEHILDEVRRNLARVTHGGPDDTNAVVDMIRRAAEVAKPANVAAAACRDANDLPILGTAVAARADCLVTGDADLLELREFRGIPILSPRQFVERVR